VGNLYLVVQHLVIQAPVMAGDDDVCPALERHNILAELGECGGVRPGHDLWRIFPPVLSKLLLITL